MVNSNSTPPPDQDTTSQISTAPFEAYNAFNEALGDAAAGKAEADSRDSEIDTSTIADNQPTTSGSDDD